jgi:AacA4 family aminoglycoside N(6')-acetyltransferase
MVDEDLAMFHDWLRRPHVTEWWGVEDAALDADAFRARYAPRVMAAANVFPFIALEDDAPIGYAQSYIALGAGGGWWEDETDPGVRGIDQFLADAARLNQGLGTRMVSALARRLFADPAVTRLQTDPSPDNARAIRCYEKAGFRRMREIVTPDGPALLMTMPRA